MLADLSRRKKGFRALADCGGVIQPREEVSMQITISGHHLEITESLHDYVHAKLERLGNHYDRITSTQVILSVDKLVQKAEATVHVSGKDIFADAESEDLYAAIDQLADKLDRQLIKHKEKQRSHR
jgi:putative sigma-54 modulation protein